MPSELLRTQPETPDERAWSAHDWRYQTPCTRPLTQTWTRTVISGNLQRLTDPLFRVPDTGKNTGMPSKQANVKNEKQYEALKDKGMSKQRAARIANSPDASSNGGKKSGSGGSSKQGGTTAQHKAAGRKGGKAAAKKS